MKSLFGWLPPVVKYFSSSIRKKIIVPYAVLTLILAGMGIFIITSLVANSFEERLKNQLLEAGRVVSDEVVNRERLRLEIERVVVNTIGVADALIDRDVDQLNELVYPVIANARAIDSIILVDTQGKEVIRFQRQIADVGGFVETSPNTNLDLSQWPAVKQTLTNPAGSKEAQLAQDLKTNELIVYTVGPIRNQEGSAVGAALVGTYLANEINYLHSLALAHLVLFDENGQVIGLTFPLDAQDQTEIFRIFTPERYQQVVQSKRVTLLDEVDIPEGQEDGKTLTVHDRNYRLAYAPFILRNRVYGVYAVALATNFITDTTGQSQTLLITLFTLGAVAVFGIGSLISRLISQPILQLVRTARAISAGDLSRRSGLKGDDEVGILATTFDDMTTRLQHLLKLQQEEASKLNAILNSIADGVIVQDVNGQLLIVNPAAKAILERLERNFLQASTQKGLKDEVTRQAEIEIQTSILFDHLADLKFRQTDRLEVGRLVLSALSAPVLTSDNAQLGTVVILRDITREVESEKLKDEFITSISHELKTPLTAIKGYNSLLKMILEMKPAGQVEERQLSIVKTMEKELTDLDNLIQAMLDLSQIDAGELGVDHEPLDLSALVRTEAENWTDKMAARELEFTTDLPDEPIWVEGDHNRLTRVLYNLIKNAHDYTLPGGKVEISIKRENGQAQVEIADNGVGIAEEDQPFLYTRFFRAIHDQDTYEVSGAGLGLYMSKAIVEAHRGQLWMKSRLHEGSIVSFALPVIEPDEEMGG
jgi:signal transduction histidine kinase